MAIYRNTAAGGKWTETKAWEEETAPTVWTAAVKAPGIADVVNLVKAGGTIEVATATTAEAKEILANTGGNEFEKTLKVTSTGILKVAGSIIFSTAMTWTIGTGKVEVTNTSGTAEVNFQGKEGQELVQNGSGGTVKLMGAMPLAAKVLVTAGTMETNGQEISCTKFEAAAVAKLKLGASTIKCTTTGEAWSVVEGTTVEAGTSTIELTNTSETAKKFHGGSKTYYTLIIATDNAEIQGSNTFTNLRINTRGKSVKGTLFEKSSVQNIAAGGEFTTNATEAEKIKMKSGLAGKVWKIKKASGTVEVTGVEMQDGKGEGGATFRVVNGVNVSGNEGWTFVHEHTLSATQGQSASRVITPGRVLSKGQAQAATHPQALARALTITQPQSATTIRGLARALRITQPQSATTIRGLARALTITQGQAASYATTGAHLLNVGQGQSASKETTTSRTFALEQGQSASSQLSLAVLLGTTQVSSCAQTSSPSSSLSCSAGQVVACAIGVGRIVSSSQGQAASKAVTLTRNLAAEQGQGASKSLTVAESLAAAQAQAASLGQAQSAALGAGQGQGAVQRRVVARALGTAQSTSPTIVRALARLLLRGQAQGISLGALVVSGEHLLSATATSTPRVVRGVSRTLSKTQGASTRVVRGVSRTSTASQGATVVVARGVARRFVLGQGQTPTIDLDTHRLVGGKATSSVEEAEGTVEASSEVATSSAGAGMVIDSTIEVRV